MNGSIKAVLFDLDDTLYEEITFVRSGFRAVTSHLCERFQLNRDELFLTMMEILSKENRGKVFDKVLEHYGLYHPRLVEELVCIYRSHQPNIHLYLDAKPTFQMLKSSGIKLGIITDGLHAVQRNKVTALGLQELMDIIIYTDEQGRDYWKPHPATFQRAIKVLAINPSEAVYIGNDPAKDFAGPNATGMVSVHLHRSGNVAEFSCKANFHIAELNQLVQGVMENIRGNI